MTLHPLLAYATARLRGASMLPITSGLTDIGLSTLVDSLNYYFDLLTWLDMDTTKAWVQVCCLHTELDRRLRHSATPHLAAALYRLIYNRWDIETRGPREWRDTLSQAIRPLLDNPPSDPHQHIRLWLLASGQRLLTPSALHSHLSPIFDNWCDSSRRTSNDESALRLLSLRLSTHYLSADAISQRWADLSLYLSATLNYTTLPESTLLLMARDLDSQEAASILLSRPTLSLPASNLVLYLKACEALQE